MINDQLLIVSGTGRNTGKTSLSCKLISHFSHASSITAIKTTHHFHALSYQMVWLKNAPEYSIFQDFDKNQEKDSSKMLKAGASNVFYIQSKREALGKAFLDLVKFIPEQSLIICESGGLKDFIQPAVSILCIKEVSEILLAPQADLYYDYKQEHSSSIISKIQLNGCKWSINRL